MMEFPEIDITENGSFLRITKLRDQGGRERIMVVIYDATTRRKLRAVVTDPLCLEVESFDVATINDGEPT